MWYILNNGVLAFYQYKIVYCIRLIKSTAKGTDEKKQAFDSLFIYFDASFTSDG